MKTSDFDYYLPDELIAQTPPDKREDARMMVLHRSTGLIEHRLFSDLSDYLNANDLLVVNNTKIKKEIILFMRFLLTEVFINN